MKYPKILRTIHEFYPTSVDSDNLLNEVKIQKFYDLCNKKNEREFEFWQELKKNIKQRLPRGRTVVDESNIFFPSFRARINISKEDQGEFILLRQVWCCISMVTRAYTIFGMDHMFSDSIKLKFHPSVSISPIDIFEPYFVVFRESIEKRLPDYAFLQFSTLSTRIEGIHVPEWKFPAT